MNKKVSFCLWGILLLELLYIFTFLLNYDLAWMNSEKFGVHEWILSNGPQWKAEDWAKFLNINVIEDNPYRLSRPLSNFIEVVDTKWRASMWNIMTPHPALSLQWPFMFILLPWLLYRTFVNMGCLRFVALMGVCVYLASPGFLGPLVMLFHPAKNLANFFGVLAMFFFSLSYKELPDFPKKGGGWAFLAGYLSLFLAFFSDETGIYLYMATLLLFHRLWLQLWRDRRYLLLSGLGLLPLFYVLTIRFFLPYLHWAIRGAKIHLTDYDCYPSAKTLFWPNWNFFWENTKFLFADHPHLLINYKILSEYPWILSLQIVYVAAALFMIFLFFKSLPKSDDQQKATLSLLLAGVLLMVGYCFLQTFQLSKNAKIWGVWWYGSLFSFIYVFALAFFLQFVFSKNDWLCKWAPVIAAIFVLNGLIFTTYRLGECKLQNLNRAAYSFVGIFQGRVDPYGSFNFRKSLERSYCKEMYAHIYWQRWKHLPDDVDPAQKEKCYSGELAADFYFMTEENEYLPSELH